MAKLSGSVAADAIDACFCDERSPRAARLLGYRANEPHAKRHRAEGAQRVSDVVKNKTKHGGVPLLYVASRSCMRWAAGRARPQRAVIRWRSSLRALAQDDGQQCRHVSPRSTERAAAEHDREGEDGIASTRSSAKSAWTSSMLPRVRSMGAPRRRLTSAMSRTSTDPCKLVSTPPERETRYFLISLNSFGMPPMGASFGDW